MELLYRYFMLWYCYYKSHPKNSNQTAFFNALIIILVVFFYICFTFYYIIYRHIILGEPRFQMLIATKSERYMQVIAYLGIGYQILKWLIVKKMRFDIESGTSDRYSFVPTKRQRTINLIINILICALPFAILILYKKFNQ